MRKLVVPLLIGSVLAGCYADDGGVWLDSETGLPVVPTSDGGRVDRDAGGQGGGAAPDADDGPITLPGDDTGRPDAAPDTATDAGAPLDVAVDVAPADNWPSDWIALEDRVLVLVNERRARGAQCGGESFGAAAPLVANAELRAAARVHAEDMAARGYFDHVAPDGSDPFDRIDAAGYRGGFPQGENIAAGYRDAESVVTGWMNSPGHCANIMERGFGAIGVGFVFDDGSEMGAYWVQTFGARP